MCYWTLFHQMGNSGHAEEAANNMQFDLRSWALMQTENQLFPAIQRTTKSEQ